MTSVTSSSTSSSSCFAGESVGRDPPAEPLSADTISSLLLFASLLLFLTTIMPAIGDLETLPVHDDDDVTAVGAAGEENADILFRL